MALTVPAVKQHGSAVTPLLDDLERIPMNTLFVRAVVRRSVDGELHADSAQRAFYAVHPYGMSFLWGEPNREWIAARLTRRTARPEWLQVYPNRWVPVVEDVLRTQLASGAAVRSTRVNFTFHPDAYRRPSPTGAVVPLTQDMFGTEGGVVPKHFWRDAQQFFREAGGFAAIVDGNVAAIAFGSFRHRARLEIGIETVEAYRGRGHARVVASALIDACLERGLEPVWACRFENVASYRLALTLGFVPTWFGPYYRLPMLTT